MSVSRTTVACVGGPAANDEDAASTNHFNTYRKAYTASSSTSSTTAGYKRQRESGHTCDYSSNGDQSRIPSHDEYVDLVRPFFFFFSFFKKRFLCVLIKCVESSYLFILMYSMVTIFVLTGFIPF